MQSAHSNMSMYAGRRRRRPVKRLTPTTGEVKTNPSKRHRDRLNTELDTLASLLPLDEETVSKLDKLSILRLCVSYLRNKSYFKAIPNKHMLQLSDISRPAAIEAPNPPTTQTLPGNDFDGQCENDGKTNEDWADLISSEEGQMLIQALNGFVIVVQQDGQIFYVSNTIQEYLGFQDSDILHQCVFELIHKDDRLMFQQQMSLDPIITVPEAETTGQELLPAANIHFTDSVKRNFECRFRCLLDESSGFLKLKFSGRLRPLYGQRVRGKDGIPVDKEPPELALFALACPVEQYSIVEIHIRNTIFRTKHDLSFQPLAADKMGVEVLGYSEIELIQLPGYHYIHYEDLIYLSDLHSNLLRKGEIPYCYFRLYRKTGKWMWVQVKPRLIYKNDQPDYIVSTHRPMSDDEGEQHHKHRGNPFKFPFKTSSSLYDLNNPYPPMPKEIIDYINNGFKPQFGKEGGPPIDFGAMGPPGSGPPGGGPPNGARPHGGPPMGMPPSNMAQQAVANPNIGMPTRNAQPPVAVVQPRNTSPLSKGMPSRTGHIQPPNGLGSMPQRNMITASHPGVTSNRIDTVQSFMGPDGTQNTILQTQVTRCANQIEKLKIPDNLGFGADFSDVDMIQVASMIDDQNQQMFTDSIALASGDTEMFFGSDTIPTFDDTIKPLGRLTDITVPLETLSASQEDQICQFVNADVPRNIDPMPCMQDTTHNSESKDMFHNTMINGDMNQKNNISITSNHLSNFQQQCQMAQTTLPNNKPNFLLDGNSGKSTGLTSGSKLHGMLMNPVQNTRPHCNQIKATNDSLKRERTHTVEYLPNGPKLANSSQPGMNPTLLRNSQPNHLMEQQHLMQSANYRGAAPVVPMNTQVFETPGSHGIMTIENKDILLQTNFNQGTVNTDNQMGTRNVNQVSLPENHIQMMYEGSNMTNVNNQRIMNAGNSCRMVPANQELNRSGLKQMLSSNSQFVDQSETMHSENQRQDLNSGYHMMNGNQGMNVHEIRTLQNQRIAPTVNPGMINSVNKQGMMSAQNQGIMNTRIQQGMMNVNNQGITVGNHGNTNMRNSQGMIKARIQGNQNSGNNPEIMSANRIPVPENHHPAMLNSWNQQMVDTGNQLGIDSLTSSTPVTQNLQGMSGNLRSLGNHENQVLMNSRVQGVPSTVNHQEIAASRNFTATNPGNHERFSNFEYKGIGNTENQGIMYSHQGMLGTGGMDQASIQQEMMELMKVSGQEVKGHVIDPNLIKNRIDEQNQKMFFGNQPMTASALNDAMIYNVMQKQQMQATNNQGMKNMMYCMDNIPANQQMDERGMRMQGERVSRPSTDSGGTAYNSPGSILNDYSSSDMQVTPHSVFSSPSGSGGSPNTGLLQQTLTSDSFQQYY